MMAYASQCKPMTVNAGQQGLTQASEGQQWPMMANNGLCKPTTANTGQWGPMRANKGQQYPLPPCQYHQWVIVTRWCVIFTNTTNESSRLVGVLFLYLTPPMSHHGSLVCYFYILHHQWVIVAQWCVIFYLTPPTSHHNSLVCIIFSINTTSKSQWLVGVFTLYMY
jgi:hypothetical protein